MKKINSGMAVCVIFCIKNKESWWRKILKSNWIWIPEWNAKDKEKPQIVYFRKVFFLDRVPEKLEINISADSRYKLYVNEVLAEIGPSKGDHQVWYYDTVDLAPYLVQGENVLAVIVLRYPTDSEKGNGSVFRTDTPGLYLAGAYESENGEFINLSADESWKCERESHIQIIPANPAMDHLYFLELAEGNPKLSGWKRAGYQDDTWKQAQALGWEIVKKMAESPANLQPRNIPYMDKIPRRFQGIQKIRQSATPVSGWNKMLAGDGVVKIPANSVEVVEINAGELMTGFLKLSLMGGQDTKIKILQSEAYYLPKLSPDAKDGELEKRDRLDSDNGQLSGLTDSYKVAGMGCDGGLEIYEPFWFRTFRFIQLEITTAAKPLIIDSFTYLETGYPLKVKTWVKTSDETMNPIWEISERTLRRCMHETYMDCPFYEQMQYVMDTRSQILYTYAVSADDRLARKCFEDFRRSQRYDGMIACCYPSVAYFVIPSFAIYYILMLHDHMMYFGDRALMRSYLRTIDGILDYFNSHLSENGLVDKIGGRLFQEKAWSFIDWSVKWDDTGGMPTAGLIGPITMESLLYILGLERAGDIADFAGWEGVAKEYRQRAEAVRKAVRTNCTGSSGMLQDGPGVEQYSQHCQVFAVLTDTVAPDQGKENLLKTLKNTSEYAQCTVAMAYYLFRALEKCDLYEYTKECWDVWRDMVKNHLTTCVESPESPRSDCHAWGALALFELPAVVLGVRPTKPGFEEIEVKPMAGPFTWAKGEVVTPKGTVKVEWKKDGDQIVVKVT